MQIDTCEGIESGGASLGVGGVIPCDLSCSTKVLGGEIDTGSAYKNVNRLRMHEKMVQLTYRDFCLFTFRSSR